jgi:hypothetical protein
MKQKRDAIGQWVCGNGRYRTLPHGNFAGSCRSNRVQLDFSGTGLATTYSLNSSVEITEFDFSVTVLYLTVTCGV